MDWILCNMEILSTLAGVLGLYGLIRIGAVKDAKKLSKRYDENFIKLDQHLTKIDHKLGSIDRRLNGIEKQIAVIETIMMMERYKFKKTGTEPDNENLGE